MYTTQLASMVKTSNHTQKDTTVNTVLKTNDYSKFKNKQGGLIKMIIVIIIAIAVLSYFGIDIKNFFTSPIGVCLSKCFFVEHSSRIVLLFIRTPIFG
jgi:hypothetical protein